MCGSGIVQLMHAGGRQCYCIAIIAISELAACGAVMAARLILGLKEPSVLGSSVPLSLGSSSAKLPVQIVTGVL